MFRFTIRDVLWLTVVVGLAIEQEIAEINAILEKPIEAK